MLMLRCWNGHSPRSMADRTSRPMILISPRTVVVTADVRWIMR